MKRVAVALLTVLALLFGAVEVVNPAARDTAVAPVLRVSNHEAPAFPFKQVDDVIPFVMGMQPTCEGEAGIVGLVNGWRIITHDSGRDLFITWNESGGGWVYAVQVEDDKSLTVKLVLSLDEARKRWPSGCEWYQERETDSKA